jgi:nitroreductase
MLEKLVFKNRSYRRFHQKIRMTANVLKDMINLARLSPSAGNLQPLKYIISCEESRNEVVFGCLKWAAYLADWKGPAEGEKPPAYIIILGDKNITQNFGCDHGIAAQSILLGATEKGFGGCILASIDREKLRSGLKIGDQYEILLVLAIGKPREAVVFETARGNDIKYWRDEANVHHVPKRTLDEILISIP